MNRSSTKSRLFGCCWSWLCKGLAELSKLQLKPVGSTDGVKHGLIIWDIKIDWSFSLFLQPSVFWFPDAHVWWGNTRFWWCFRIFKKVAGLQSASQTLLWWIYLADLNTLKPSISLIFPMRSSLVHSQLGDFCAKATYSAAIVACGRALQLSQVLRLANCGGVSSSWGCMGPGSGGIWVCIPVRISSGYMRSGYITIIYIYIYMYVCVDVCMYVCM